VSAYMYEKRSGLDKKKKKEIIEEWPNKLILLSSTVINFHFSPL
jgi:hypothetical protein